MASALLLTFAMKTRYFAFVALAVGCSAEQAPLVGDDSQANDPGQNNNGSPATDNGGSANNGSGASDRSGSRAPSRPDCAAPNAGGLDIQVAYGNATSDICAYAELRIDPAATYIIGQHAGAACDGYESIVAVTDYPTPNRRAARAARASPAEPNQPAWRAEQAEPSSYASATNR